MTRIPILLPFDQDRLLQFKAGDLLALTGVLYTARDAAHKRMVEALRQGTALPFDVKGQTIYYAGPCPGRPGSVIGAIGPTTSGRMDAYAPDLIRAGLVGMIGKGARQPAVVETMKACGAVYFGATGGAGALLAQRITRAEVIAYPDLGAEAIRRLWVVDFPVIVLIDSQGHNLYETGPLAYREI